MSRSRGKALPDSLAAALADGTSIDWRAAETGVDGATHADLIRQLRVIAAMRGRPGTSLAARRGWLRQMVSVEIGRAHV